eukprot:COSAG02_NODE_1962_length_10253_cov_6.942294_14_plen_79_part_01
MTACAHEDVACAAAAAASCREEATRSSRLTSLRTALAVWLVRKRKVLVLNGQSRPKRPKNGLYQGHAARASVGTSTSEA